MTEVLINSLIVSVAGGILSLDRTAALQMMVSRPIVTAPVIGLLLGDAPAGLVTGAALELLLMGDLPVGAYVPVHETAVSALVTALTVSALGYMDGTLVQGMHWAQRAVLVFPAALLVALPLGAVYRWADAFTRGVNARFFKNASARLAGGADTAVMRENLKGLAPFFLTITAALFITVFPLLSALHLIFDTVRFTGAGFLYPAFAGAVVLGTAAALYSLRDNVCLILFAAASAVTGVVLVILR